MNNGKQLMIGTVTALQLWTPITSLYWPHDLVDHQSGTTFEGYSRYSLYAIFAEISPYHFNLLK